MVDQREKRARRKPWRGEASLREYTDNAIRAASKAWRPCLREFAAWLEHDRGLAPESITGPVASIRTFLDGQSGTGVRTLKRLGVTDVEDFFIDYAKHHGPQATRSMQNALRKFLAFAALGGWTRAGLSEAVPSMRSYKLSRVPRGLSDEGVRILVASTSLRSARDRALVLLLVVYGVRRGQVSALNLDDIDWRERTIRFAPHKLGKEVLHSLAPVVADALATYLRRERPKVSERAVFLRVFAPHTRLGPSAVTAVVDSALRRAGVTCKPRGPHALRHAFATRLMKQGQPPKVIADLLGHASLDSVAIYAKVDHPRMLEVAVEWPEALP